MSKSFLLILIISISCSSEKVEKSKPFIMKEIIRSTVSTKGEVDLEVINVWNKLASFGGTEKFVPDIIEKVDVKGYGVGAVRTIHLVGGGEIVEELTKLDELYHHIEFIILSTPMPIENYVGTYEIRELSRDRCEVSFTSIFNVETQKKSEMEIIVKGFQETFISNLDK